MAPPAVDKPPAIAVTGATGQVGSLIARALVARGLPFRALARDPLRAAWLRDQAGVELTIASSEAPRALRAALAGVEVLILIPPFEAYMEAYEQVMLEAAVAAGVKRVVRLSGVGAALDAESRALRMHRQGEIALAGCGLGWANLRANAFHQNAAWLMQWMLSSEAIYGTDLEQPVGWVDARDVADCLIACALSAGTAEEHELSGPEALTWPEFATALGAAVGWPVHYRTMSRSRLRREMIASRWEAWPANEWIAMFDGAYFASGVGGRVTGAVASLTGREPRSFEDYAKALLPGALAGLGSGA
jgi:uncharacterized protein YbjT (DUF2867 family)